MWGFGYLEHPIKLDLFPPQCSAGSMTARGTLLFRFLLIVGLSLLGLPDLPGFAAETGATAPPTNSSAGANTNQAPIALGDIATRTESAHAILTAINSELAADRDSERIASELELLTSEISARLEDDSRTLRATTSLPALRRLGDDWSKLREPITDWKHSLANSLKSLETMSARVAALQAEWQATKESEASLKMPRELRAQVDSILAEAQETSQKINERQRLALTLQSRVVEQDARIAQALDSLEHAREQAVRNLFTQDAHPLWTSGAWNSSAQKMTAESRNSLARQAQALTAYVHRSGSRLLLNGMVFLALAAVLSWVRWKLRARLTAESALKAAAGVTEAPLSTALVLALLASGWFYPDAPRLLRALLGAATLVPAIIVLRRLLNTRFSSLLTALLLFYLVDQIRFLVASQELLSRLLFLGEMLAAALVSWKALWLTRTEGVVASEPGWSRAAKRVVIWAALIGSSVAFLANAVGYAGLSRLLGHTLLTSAYLGLVLYVAIRIAHGLIAGALSVPPLSRLGLVMRHYSFLEQRIWRLLQILAVILWAVFLLEALSLRAPLFHDFKALFDTTLTVGTHTLSVGDALLFAAAIWLAALVSKTCRFVLEEEVYPRVHLAPGLHYSISKVVHYAIVLVGFFIGVGLLGFDLSKLTILAGAFSVGLGFGLQNIVNNFISGIILLFERPIKIGDVIQWDTSEGVVERIGIRASVVRITSGAEVIVPNGKLISDPVTNWTFSRRQRFLVLPISVAAGTEPKKVAEILTAVAAAHPLIIKEPPPQALVTDLSGGVLKLELRAATANSEDLPRIRSDLVLSIYAALSEQNIAMK
jgi:small-conductance mechanosensitive channel